MSEYIFKLPDLGEGMVEAEIAEWMVKVGDFVKEEDPIGAVMTDKAAVELTTPVTGKVTSLAGEPGDMVAVGAALITFETDARVTTDESGDSAAPVTPESVQAAQPQPVAEDAPAEKTSGKVLTSPSIRQHAREAGIDLASVSGSGPRGRVLKSDLDNLLAGNVTTTGGPETSKEPPAAITEIKIVGLRRIIAERMTEANREVPHFAYVEEVDVTALESLRQHLNGKKSADEDKLTLLPFIGLALARALAHFPQINAHYDREKNVINQYQAVHLGIATQTTAGLKVPVVRHCESRSLNELAGEIRRLSTAARDNKATRDELTGSTITITSLGKAGGIVTTPIINLPEVAIIGVNKAIERPVVIDGQMVIRRMMNLSSSFDHRFVDGYDAAMMIQQVKDFLEQPATIFMHDL
jgi:2-oxoisovalerate dehydrogenase E2 component (dihydrolipoyl transacylase)